MIDEKKLKDLQDSIVRSSMIRKFLPLIILVLALWLMEIISFPLLKDAGPMPGQEGYDEIS